MIDAKELGIPERLFIDGQPYASSPLAMRALENMRKPFSMIIHLNHIKDKKHRKFKWPTDRPKDKLPRGMMRITVRLEHCTLTSRS